MIIQWSPPGIGIYSWSGQHLRHVDHTQLGVGLGDRLYAIGSDGEDTIIVAVAVGDCLKVKSLHSYRLL